MYHESGPNRSEAIRFSVKAFGLSSESTTLDSM